MGLCSARQSLSLPLKVHVPLIERKKSARTGSIGEDAPMNPPPGQNPDHLPTTRDSRTPTLRLPADGHAGDAVPANGCASDLPPRNYELGPAIGRGGMGAVLQVRDRNIERTVAMKIILDPPQGQRPRAPRRPAIAIPRPARHAGRRSHPARGPALTDTVS